MFTNPRKSEFLRREYRWLWMGLAFQAGFANAGGFLACARYVSHMTGFGTQVGISLSSFDYMMAFELISAPASFLLGAMASAFAVDVPMLRGKKPRYLLVMLGIVFVFTLVTLGGINDMFGKFGEPLIFQRDFALMSLLCFVCGLQNACFGSLTRGQIRTTHLTGILTDIGVTFVTLFHMERVDRRTKILKRMNYIRMLTFGSFSSGSMIAAILFARLEFHGFAFLILCSATLMTIAAIKQSAIQRRARASAKWAIERAQGRPEVPAAAKSPFQTNRRSR